MKRKAIPVFDLNSFSQDLGSVVAEKQMTKQEISNETGLSRATITRILGGERMCDGPSLAILCKWAGLSAENYVIWPGSHPAKKTLEAKVTALIRTDTSLPDKAKDAIIRTVVVLYKALV